MAENNEKDDRSMSEILASIRKIVTDEEQSRQSAAEERRRREAETGGEVFVLTGTMRSDAPLELSAADLVHPAASAPAASAPEAIAAETVDFLPAPGLTEDEIEAIVRRVVREELQGPIGQQISRKVKALIRDEVVKALLEEESLL